MSTDIKPGQIWAWQDTDHARGPHGFQFEIADAAPHAPDVAYRYPDAAGFNPDQTYGAPAEVVAQHAVLVGERNELTPAPIDPHAVKPGDTVVVRFIQTGDVITTEAYRPEDITAGRWVSVLGWPLVKADGTFGLAVKHFELLDHQPAPEPEPEWKPGTVAKATVRGIANVQVMRLHPDPEPTEDDPSWVSVDLVDRKGKPLNGWDGKFVHNAVDVTDVRPLVVIDPATARKVVVDALATVLPSATVDYELLNAATDAVVVALGIRSGGAR